MNYLKKYINAGFALLLACTFAACDSKPEAEKTDTRESDFKRKAGTSRAITKAGRIPEVELILDEMTYIGVGNDINVVLAGNLLFRKDESAVIAREHPDLDKLAKLLEYYPNSELRITGFAPDAVGAGNKRQLAQARADAVKQFMVDSMDIKADRITASEAGAGDDNNRANEMQLGQRVEVLILTQADSLSRILRDSVQVRKEKQDRQMQQNR